MLVRATDGAGMRDDSLLAFSILVWLCAGAALSPLGAAGMPFCYTLCAAGALLVSLAAALKSPVPAAAAHFPDSG